MVFETGRIAVVIPWLAIFALLVVLTAAGTLLPLLLGRRKTFLGRAQGALAIHRSRFEQIARDRERGLISPEEAAGAQTEIGRVILAASHEVTASGDKQNDSGGFWPVAGILVLSLSIGFAVYSRTGSYGTPDLPLSARALPAPVVAPTLASEHEGSQMQQAIASLRKRLEQAPGSVENWNLLARSYSAIGAYPQAAEAYERLIALAPQDLEVRGNYAETLVRKDEGFVGPKAVEQLNIVLSHAPKDPRARYYMALRDAQAGNDQAAAEGWAGILRDAPPDAPYRAAIRSILEAVIEDAGLDRASLNLPEEPVAPARPARGPTQSDITAATEMSDDDQLAMIRSMVDQLEARLGESPDDIEGWLRLARSRMVLGEREAAIAALERGLVANPDVPALVAALNEFRGAASE